MSVKTGVWVPINNIKAKSTNNPSSQGTETDPGGMLATVLTPVLGRRPWMVNGDSNQGRATSTFGPQTHIYM